VVVWKASYEPFGLATEDLDPDGDSTNIRLPVRFPGQWWDFATGYHYNMFRDYDPVTGRYLEADPIGQSGAMNLFSYAANAPTGVIDPLGWFVRNFTNRPMIIKPETGPIAVLPPMSEWDGSPDGIWLPDPDGGDYREGEWRKYPGKPYLPDIDIILTPDEPNRPYCVGGPCMWFPYKDLPVAPDQTWRLPPAFERLPGSRPIPSTDQCE
jgi:RHS repeat-associated protein